MLGIIIVELAHIGASPDQPDFDMFDGSGTGYPTSGHTTVAGTEPVVLCWTTHKYRKQVVAGQDPNAWKEPTAAMQREAGGLTMKSYYHCHHLLAASRHEAPGGRASILSSPLAARPNAPVQQEILGAVSPTARMSATSSAPSPVAPSAFTPPTVENPGPVPTDPTALAQTNNVLEAFINWTSKLHANMETLVRTARNMLIAANSSTRSPFLDAFLTLTNGSTGILDALRAARGRGLTPLQVARRADRERTRRLARLGQYAKYGLRTLEITAGDITNGCTQNASNLQGDDVAAIESTLQPEQLRKGPGNLHFHAGVCPPGWAAVIAMLLSGFYAMCSNHTFVETSSSSTLCVPSTLFRTGYRMVPQIAKLVDDVVYHSALEDGEGTAVDTRPLAREVAKFNCANFKATPNNVVMFDILPLTR
ncbi:hypothetical protein ABEF95_008821 [Exophiala dermatitidis]